MMEARQPAAAGRYPLPADPGRRAGIQPQPVRRTRKVQLLLIICACIFFALVVVAQYSQMVILSYQLSGARNDLKILREETRELEAEAAGLGSINRIEEVARQELGMVEPEMGQLRLLSYGH